MSKMKIKRVDRPEVKLACLRSLAQLRLNPAQNKLVSGFIDTYLKMGPSEQSILQAQLDRIEPREKEAIMEITTSWMEQGIEQGRGREAALLLRLGSCQIIRSHSPVLTHEGEFCLCSRDFQSPGILFSRLRVWLRGVAN